MGRINTTPQRIAPEMEDLIRFVKARALMKGKRVTTRTITKKIAELIDKERLLQDEFIAFK